MQDPNPILPDFSHFYGNKKLSDVDIVLIEEETGATAEELPDDENATMPAAVQSSAPAAPAPACGSKRNRQDGEHLFGHSLALAGFSGYCRTKLMDWDDTHSTAQQGSSRASKHEIQLPVPAGQLEVGRLLIRGMYQQQPDLSDVSQAQLLQLLLLADRFEVPKVQAAVSTAFSAMPLDQLQWETALAVYGLPGGCAKLAAFKDLFSAASAKLQQELGDLELVLTVPQSSKAQQLVELPFAALKQLLQDERTRVASENTVVYAIQRWHSRQKKQLEARHNQQCQQKQHLQSLRQQAKELLQLVRMPQCSQLFIASIIDNSAQANSRFSSSDLLLASRFSRSATGQLQLPSGSLNLPVFQRHPAWLLPARPASAMTQLTTEWQLPLAQLKETFEQHLETGKDAALDGEIRVWRALYVFPRLTITSESSDGSEGPSRQLGLFCRAIVVEGMCRAASVALRAKSFKRGKADIVKSCSVPGVMCSGVNGVWGWDAAIELGPVSSWAAAETVLRNKGLVGSGNCLHLSLTVTDVD